MDQTVSLPAHDSGRWSSLGWSFTALALCLPLLVTLLYSLVRTPYALSEVVAVLYDADTKSSRELVLGDGVYFRPLFWLAIRAVWRTADSVTSALLTYRLLHALSVTVVAIAFLAVCRPTGWAGVAAFAVAFAALIAPGGFRDNLESLPLNQSLWLIALALAAIWLLRRPPDRANPGLAVATVTLALAMKEQGLIVALILIVGYAVGHRGVGRRATIGVTAIVLTYMAVRIGSPGDWPVFMRSIGLGTVEVSEGEALARYGAFPYPIYAYNAMATVLNVLAGEPTRGIFMVSDAVRDGRSMPWHWVQVGTSIATSTLLIVWGWQAWRRRAEDGARRDLLLFTIFIFGALLPSALLSYNYTRDRFGGVAVAVYALCVFRALLWLFRLEHPAGGTRRIAVAAFVLALSAGWHLRAAGTVQYERRMAWENRKEWIVDFFDRQHKKRYARHGYQELMTEMYAQGTDPTLPPTTADPGWVERWLGGAW